MDQGLFTDIPGAYAPPLALFLPGEVPRVSFSAIHHRWDTRDLFRQPAYVGDARRLYLVAACCGSNVSRAVSWACVLYRGRVLRFWQLPLPLSFDARVFEARGLLPDEMGVIAASLLDYDELRRSRSDLAVDREASLLGENAPWLAFETSQPVAK